MNNNASTVIIKCIIKRHCKKNKKDHTNLECVFVFPAFGCCVFTLMSLKEAVCK